MERVETVGAWRKARKVVEAAIAAKKGFQRTSTRERRHGAGRRSGARSGRYRFPARAARSRSLVSDFKPFCAQEPVQAGYWTRHDSAARVRQPRISGLDQNGRSQRNRLQKEIFSIDTATITDDLIQNCGDQCRSGKGCGRRK